MILKNNNISPLPFYSSLNKQDYKKEYSFGVVYPLIAHLNYLLPFQLIVSRDNIRVDRAILHYFNSSKTIDITNDLRQNGLRVLSKTAYNIIEYPAILPIASIESIGKYYLELVFNTGESAYSDIISCVDDISCFVKIEYSNSYNFKMRNGEIDFSNNFKFYCYLDTQIGKPEYIYEETATNRMGYDFIQSQVSKKLYKFTFLAPEYLCDALRLIRLCNYKKISIGVDADADNFEPISFAIEPKWTEQSNIASVEAEFEIDTVIANIPGFSSVPLDGDFNNDYNNDFNN